MNANASTFVPSSLLRKKEAQREQREEEEEDEYFAIDVECVATGHTHNDRAVAQIAVVDERMRTLVNVFVKPGTAANEGTSGASTSSTVRAQYKFQLTRATSPLSEHLNVDGERMFLRAIYVKH